jgi:predicted nucleotidyltransferase
LIELDPTAELDLFGYVGLRRYIADLFTGPVDVVDRDALKPYVRPPAESDAIYAF